VNGWKVARWRGKLSNEARIDLIFPGTKWCGSGNIASNFTDLGTSSAADSCCREHDNCPDIIEAGQTKYNLTNNSFYTKLICKCDEEFYKCLKKNNDYTSYEVGLGILMFWEPNATKKDYPIVKCRKSN
ncbi:hypothetical protein L9F63_027898, partial [Diploptera punctata]